MRAMKTFKLLSSAAAILFAVLGALLLSECSAEEDYVRLEDQTDKGKVSDLANEELCESASCIIVISNNNLLLS